MKNKQPGFATKAIHAGQYPDPETGAVSVPIYPTSTYVQQELGKNKGYEYARVSNPTRTRLEENLARSKAASPRASSPAAWQRSMPSAPCTSPATMSFAATISTAACLAFSTRSWRISEWNLPTSIPADARNVERAIRKNTRMVYVETPTNPLMSLSDIEAISQICRRKKVELVVDNTFMSPYFQQPIALGADMVVHSTTKFLNGHSDGLGGVVVCTTQEQADKLAFVQKAAGAILSPFECWLVLRGVKTLAVRMEQHDRNGRVIAEFLARHKKVKKVFYPGLPDHPQHELATGQMTGFGSMITFETGSLAECQEIVEKSSTVFSGRVAGRSGNVDLASRHHDSRCAGREGKKRNRNHRWPGAHLRRHRERRRYHGRPGKCFEGDLRVPEGPLTLARHFGGEFDDTLRVP